MPERCDVASLLRPSDDGRMSNDPIRFRTGIKSSRVATPHRSIRVICIHVYAVAAEPDGFLYNTCTQAVLSEMIYSIRRTVERVRQAFIAAGQCTVSTSIWSFVRFITTLIKNAPPPNIRADCGCGPDKAIPETVSCYGAGLGARNCEIMGSGGGELMQKQCGR